MPGPGRARTNSAANSAVVAAGMSPGKTSMPGVTARQHGPHAGCNRQDMSVLCAVLDAVGGVVAGEGRGRGVRRHHDHARQPGAAQWGQSREHIAQHAQDECRPLLTIEPRPPGAAWPAYPA